MSRTASLPRLIAYAMLASIAAFAFSSSGAMADPTVPPGCDKVRGEILCSSSDPVGNCENDQCQTRDEKTSSRGNLTNKKCTCTSGPGNQITCTPTGCTPSP
jgi:hypothetical protein